ncbi:unnamed protein product, partial [marine sediment metagenome]
RKGSGMATLEQIERRVAILESRVRELSKLLPGGVVITKDHKLGVRPFYAVFYKCPSCEKGRLAPTYRYCPECGAKVEWRRDNLRRESDD